MLKRLLIIALASMLLSCQTTQTDSGRSVASTQTEEDLKAQLFNRWEKTTADQTFPAFLKGRLEEDPKFDALDPAVARAILLSDSAPYAGKVSDLVSDEQRLVRQIKLKYLFEFLHCGNLLPRNYVFRSDAVSPSRMGVYLELRTWKTLRALERGYVELHFLPEVLDRRDYYITPMRNLGNFHPLSAAPTVYTGRVKFFVESYLGQAPANEIVFTQPVGVSFLDSISVKKGKKVSLISVLKAKKVPRPKHWKNWNDHIFER